MVRCPGKTRLHPFDNDGPLEFREDAKHLEHRLTRRGSRIEALLKKCDEVLQGSPKAVDRPGGYLVEFPPGKSFAELPVLWALSRPFIALTPSSLKTPTTSQPCRSQGKVNASQLNKVGTPMVTVAWDHTARVGNATNAAELFLLHGQGNWTAERIVS